MQKRVLKNGLTILFDKRRSDSVTINIFVKVGSDHEKPKILGVSHFLEHVLFEGTKTRSALELASEIEKVGGYINAITDNDYTCYYATVPSKYFDRALEILADMTINSTFEPKVVKKEREVILDEISLALDDPNSYQWILFTKTLFKKINAKNPVAGTYKTVARITRDEILRYYKRYYAPNNIIVSVAGNANSVFSKVGRLFRVLKAKKLSREKKVKEPRDKKAWIKREKKKIKHSYLVIGYKVPSILHRDSAAIEVARAILGKGQSSRLFNEIRTKRGLGYVVGAQHMARVDYGYFACYVSADKKNIPTCREIILNELKLPNLTRKEVKEAKDYIIGSILIKNEANEERVQENAWLHMAGMDLKSYLKAIKAVKFEEVAKIAKKYFNGNYSEVLLEQR